jgi:AcrR family transcriptional regulator
MVTYTKSFNCNIYYMSISPLLKARRQKEKDALKKKIKLVAKKIAIKEGWSAVTIRRIASEIQYSLPVIYSHFKDKAEIIFSIAEEGYIQLTEALTEVITTKEKDSENYLFNLANAYVTFGIENPSIYQVMYGIQGMSTYEDKESEYSQNLYKTIIAVAKEYVTNNTEEHFNLIWANLHGLISLIHLNKFTLSDTERNEYIKRILSLHTANVK